MLMLVECWSVNISAATRGQRGSDGIEKAKVTSFVLVVVPQPVWVVRGTIATTSCCNSSKRSESTCILNRLKFHHKCETMSIKMQNTMRTRRMFC
jgi:hypothetical protein